MLALELWQLKGGTIFDNILLTDSEDEAERYLDDTYKAQREAEKRAKADFESEQRAREKAMDAADDDPDDDWPPSDDDEEYDEDDEYIGPYDDATHLAPGEDTVNWASPGNQEPPEGMKDEM